MSLEAEISVKALRALELADYSATCRKHYHALGVIAGRGKLKPIILADKKPDTLKIERTGTPLERALAAEKRSKKKCLIHTQAV